MTYDLIVIGSGPGGYSAAIRAGQYGLKTAIVEKDPKLGGTCLHVGCIPTKSLLHTADVWEHFVHSAERRHPVRQSALDYAKVLDRKNKIVAKHAKGVEFLMKKNKIDWVKGFGTIQPRGGKALLEVEVKSDGRARRRSKPRTSSSPPARRHACFPACKPDAKTILTNIEILDLPAIPKTMVIIGAGAVGVEFASIFNRFGTKVTVLEMLPRLVPVEDEEVSKELERYFKKTGIRCETGAKAENITQDGRRRPHVRRAGERQARGPGSRDTAGGRRPQADHRKYRPGQAQASSLTAVSSKWTQISRPANPASTPSATSWPARRNWRMSPAWKAWWRSRTWRANRRSRSTATASPAARTPSPASAASASPKRRRARQGYAVKVGKFPFAANSKASILGMHEGFVKVVAEEKFGEILGVHIIGPEAYELVAEAVTAMEAGSHCRDADGHHPRASDVV